MDDYYNEDSRGERNVWKGNKEKKPVFSTVKSINPVIVYIYKILITTGFLG